MDKVSNGSFINDVEMDLMITFTVTVTKPEALILFLRRSMKDFYRDLMSVYCSTITQVILTLHSYFYC